jgi:hypothetical protein
LVNQWGYDAGDLVPYYPVTHANYKGWHGNIHYDVMSGTHYSEFEDGEPLWESEAERQLDYEVVDHMHMGISELEAFELWKLRMDNDYADLIATQESALQIGVQ